MHTVLFSVRLENGSLNERKAAGDSILNLGSFLSSRAE